MTEPLKNLYNKQLITRLGREISQHHPGFDEKSFSRSVFNNDWKDKKLKQRMRHIAQSMHLHLPADYKKAITILKPVAEKFSGFEFMFFQDYVECYGMDDFATSIPALDGWMMSIK